MTELATAFDAIVRERRSVRAFTDQRVDEALMQRVFEQAQTAPSNCNTQPWRVVVASGAIRDKLAQTLTEGMASGAWQMDFPYDGRYEGVYKDRQYDAAQQLYSSMNIERSDKDGRNAAFMRNFCFFDAPHVAFLFLPEPFGLREAADVGMYAQNFMLALTANGLASCPQTALAMNCDAVREILDVPASDRLLCGISFGYEDKSHAANTCRVGRATLGDTVKFVE
jgi:nitroreductase